jgi:hypothetical protein
MPQNIKSEFVCALEKWTHAACAGEGFFKEYEGKHYCVLHYPGRDKIDAFNEVLIKRLEAKNYDFCGAWFPDTMNFEGFNFTADANFRGAIFSANAYFGQVTFSGMANFYRATFSKNVFFHKTTFVGQANFYKAIFHMDAYFGEVTFGAEANFRSAIFKDYVRFVGSEEKKDFGTQSSLNLQFAHVEKPDHFSLHTLHLRPHWFINVDPRKFEFTDIAWPGRNGLKEELNSLNGRVAVPHRLLAITYRQLAINAEENHRYREASLFRYEAFQALRTERFRGFVPWHLDWWYWLASGYGESIGRAFIVFIALVALFALGYTRVGFEQANKEVNAPTETTQGQATASIPPPVEKGQPLGRLDAAIYSAYVSILQKPEPKPFTPSAKFLVWMETLLGPAQAALLLLALRRRFMR